MTHENDQLYDLIFFPVLVVFYTDNAFDSLFEDDTSICNYPILNSTTERSNSSI